MHELCFIMGSLLRRHLYWNLLKLVNPRQTSIDTQRLLSHVTPDIIDVPRKVKGRYASNEQKRIITDFVTESSSSVLDWNALKTSVLSINRGYINEKNINGCILETCSQQNRMDLVKSYMKYVKGLSKGKPNISLELLYIRSCYNSRNELTEDDQCEIQTSCQSLFKNNFHLLNSVLLEGSITLCIYKLY